MTNNTNFTYSILIFKFLSNKMKKNDKHDESKENDTLKETLDSDNSEINIEDNKGDEVATFELDLNSLKPFIWPAVVILSVIIFSVSFYISLTNIKVSLTTNGAVGTTEATKKDDVKAEKPSDPSSEIVSVSIDDDPFLGNKGSAKVAIVEFTDFECPFCKRHVQQTKPQIISDFVNTGKVIYVQRDFVLSFHEPAGTQGANAAQCVYDLSKQDSSKYFEYVNWYFETTATNGAGVGAVLDNNNPKGGVISVGDADTILANKASELGINKSDFEKCQSERRFANEIKSDQEDGYAVGINGTPGFVIGIFDGDKMVKGVLVSGAQPYTVFKKVIEEQLSKI